MKYRAPDDNEQAERRKHLKNYRLHVGLSIEGMAKILGISAFRLDKIEQGVQPCSEELVLQASEVWFESMEEDYHCSQPDEDEIPEPLCDIDNDTMPWPD